MGNGKFILAGVLAVVIILMGSATVIVSGQARQNAGVKATSGSKLPRTLDGKPNLQGIWSHQILTPLESSGDGKSEYTEEEAAELETLAQQRRIALRVDSTTTPPGEKTTDAYNTFWRDGFWTKIPVTTLRASQISDPEDGRLPPLSAEGKQRMAKRPEEIARLNRPAEGPEDRPLWTRCIRGPRSGPPIIGGGAYNATLQIVQSPDYVVILQEMIHESQIVPLGDGHPRIPQNVHLYKGNSRGHWEGDTLVIDTTNFRSGSLSVNNGETATTEKLHVVERYTLLDGDKLNYAFTVEDPGTWTKPWSAEYVMPRLKDQKVIVEYACHEGNRGFLYQLEGARAQEREAAEQPQQ